MAMKIRKTTVIILLCPLVTILFMIPKTNTITMFKSFSIIKTEKVNVSVFKENIFTIKIKNGLNQISKLDPIKEQFMQNGLNEEKHNTLTLQNDSSTNSSEQQQPWSNDSKHFENVSIGNNIRNDTVRIGILIPSSTRKLKSPTLQNLSLTNTCIPSIYTSIESTYEYVVYIGINKGDYLETVINQLEKFDKVRAVVSSARTFTQSVNAIAREAYKDGMNYLVRINDDSSFETKNWTSKGIDILNKYLPENIGVVGPTCHQGNTGILTHDMVHRTHLEIFDFYYPPYFHNWWADDWITNVYLPDRSTKLSTWIVKHHISLHRTRYNVDNKKKSRLVKMLDYDKERLHEYISNLKS